MPEPNDKNSQTIGQLIRANRSFRIVWYAQIVSFLGDWFHTIALYLLIMTLTGSGTAIGAVVVARLLPGLLGYPISGVLADRYSRRTLMILADVARSVIVLGFLAAVHLSSVPLLYVLMVVQFLFTALFDTCSQAVLPQIVRSDQIVKAYTVISVTWSTLLAVGSALGGIAIAAFGIPTAFVIDSASYVISAMLLSRLVVPPPSGAAGPRRTFLGDLREGTAYLRREPFVAGATLCKTGIAFGAGMTVLLPFFASQFAEAGQVSGKLTLAEPIILGILCGVRGIGTALGPLLAQAVFGEHERTLAVLITPAFLVVGAFQFVFASTDQFAIAAAALVLAAMGSSAVWVFSTSLVQIHTDDRYRGRVTSIEWMTFTFCMACLSFVVGFAKDLFPFLLLNQVAQIVALSSLFPAVLWTIFLVLVRRQLRATGCVGSYCPPEFAPTQFQTESVVRTPADSDDDPSSRAET